MYAKFQSLVSGFATANGLDYDLPPGSRRASISSSGFTVNVALFEGAGMIYLHAPAGAVPFEGREGFYRMLLEANDLFAQTDGYPLAVNGAEDLVTVQISWEIAALTQEGFDMLMTNLVNVSLKWFMKIDAYVPEAEQQGAGQSYTAEDMMNFLRV